MYACYACMSLCIYTHTYVCTNYQMPGAHYYSFSFFPCLVVLQRRGERTANYERIRQAIRKEAIQSGLWGHARHARRRRGGGASAIEGGGEGEGGGGEIGCWTGEREGVRGGRRGKRVWEGEAGRE